MIETIERSYEVEMDELLGGIVKVKLSLCIIKHYARETNGEVEVQLHTLVPSALYADGWSLLCPDYFTRREKQPATHWIGLNWMGGPQTWSRQTG